jgi:hypothetical protein
MKTNEIFSALRSGTFTNQDLDLIAEGLKFARAQLGKSIKRELKPGVQVSFISNRNGQKYTGKVRKVNIKYVVVDTALGGYRVPANMIEVE